MTSEQSHANGAAEARAGFGIADDTMPDAEVHDAEDVRDDETETDEGPADDAPDGSAPNASGSSDGGIKWNILSADDFFAPESPADLIIPGLGLGPGPVSAIVAQAFGGKTMIASDILTAVATGTPALGRWETNEGPALKLDFEQGTRHTTRNDRRWLRGKGGLSDNQIRKLIESKQISFAIYPDVRLTTPKAADHFKFALDGYRIAVIDSLRVILGNVDENSSQVRPLIAALSEASDATGCAVILIHHGGKPPSMPGMKRNERDQARGSSAIVDELQSMFVLAPKDTAGVINVTHAKDRELGRLVDPFGVRIVDVGRGNDPRWGLRIEHVPLVAKAATTGEEALREVVADVLACVVNNAGIAGREAIRKVVGRAMGDVRAAISVLLVDGTIVERKTAGKGKGVRFYVSGGAPPEGT